MSTTTNLSDDRRRTARIAVRVPVRLEHAPGRSAYMGLAVDLSAAGLRVTACPPLPVGQRLSCSIQLSSRETVSAGCRVVWVEPGATNFDGSAGLVFADLDPVIAQQISRAVDRLRTRDATTALPAESAMWPTELGDDD